METHGSWSMVTGQPGHGVVLIVTAAADRLASIAQSTASTGCYVFCAVPSDVPRVLSVSKVDLLVVLSDVTLPDRAKLVELHAAGAPGSGRLTYAFGSDERSLADFVARSLAPSP